MAATWNNRGGPHVRQLCWRPRATTVLAAMCDKRAGRLLGLPKAILRRYRRHWQSVARTSKQNNVQAQRRCATTTPFCNHYAVVRDIKLRAIICKRWLVVWHEAVLRRKTVVRRSAVQVIMRRSAA
jgi:hypothetical protein